MSPRIRVLRMPENDAATPPMQTRESGEEPSPFSVYRDRTIALLRRYFRLSIELGRLPSLLGREFFRAHVTSCRMVSFEDVVIFVHDIECCLGKLDGDSRQLIARIVLQEYTQEEAARLAIAARGTELSEGRGWLERNFSSLQGASDLAVVCSQTCRKRAGRRYRRAGGGVAAKTNSKARKLSRCGKRQIPRK